MERVVLGLVVADGRLLLVHRLADAEGHPAGWDLPGGHVDDGETDVAALRRELREEVGIDVGAVDPLPAVTEPLPAPAGKPPGVLLILRVTGWAGEARNAAPGEHDRIGWFSAAELVALRFVVPGEADSLTGLMHGERD